MLQTGYRFIFHRMLFNVIFLLMLATVLAAPAPATAADMDGATIASQGNGRGAAACATCHGTDGVGQQAAGFPRLAGLNAAYLRHQLESYANGTRDNVIMNPMAASLDERERRILADYYSTLPFAVLPEKSASISFPESEQDDPGAWLALRGRWEKQVPACVQCHGPRGIGVGEHFPPLAGQPAKYIADQLQAWQSGARRNDPLGLMKHIADALSNDDIQAVSAWLAAQSAPIEGANP